MLIKQHNRIGGDGANYANTVYANTQFPTKKAVVNSTLSDYKVFLSKKKMV